MMYYKEYNCQNCIFIGNFQDKHYCYYCPNHNLLNQKVGKIIQVVGVSDTINWQIDISDLATQLYFFQSFHSINFLEEIRISSTNAFYFIIKECVQRNLIDKCYIDKSFFDFPNFLY